MSGRLRSNDIDEDDKFIKGADGTRIGNTGDQLHVVDQANIAAVYTNIVVGTTAVHAKVGSSPLTERKILTIQNRGNQTVYWGYSSAVTTSTGTELFKNQLLTFDFGPAIEVWLISSNAGQDVRVGEAS